MPELKKYAIEVNGTKSTLLLDDEDAKARGLFKEKSAPATANKEAVKPADK